jgi:hypothetical protein
VKIATLNKAHFRNSQESNHGDRHWLLSLLWGWRLFLHRLLLMPSMSCQLICEVPFCSFVCLVVLLHRHSWTTVMRCGYHWKRHHGASSHSFDFLPLLFVPLGSGASWILLWIEWSFWKLSGNLSGIWDYKHISEGFCYNKKLFH